LLAVLHFTTLFRLRVYRMRKIPSFFLPHYIIHGVFNSANERLLINAEKHDLVNFPLKLHESHVIAQVTAIVTSN
jgi:hypothetical protein